jgi:tetratricopeptide (TPR) repeat protein/DNA-binding Xre family transcriptional regulator
MLNTRKPRSVLPTEAGIRILKIAQAGKRNDKGKPWTYNNIAEKANVGEQTVKRFFGRKESIQETYAIPICEALGVNPAEVLEYQYEDKIEQLSRDSSSETTSIDELVQTACNKIKPTPTRYENIPLSGVVEFVGRETQLQNLHQLLQENQQVAIAGMGGVGKTELALQYAYSHRVTYQGGIWWLSALKDVGVQLVQFADTKQLLNIPDDLDLVGRVQFCLTKWHEGEVLLIIDNVTNYREEVRRYLESVPSRFKQLITTREKLQPPIVRLDLDVLTPLEAMKLLKSIVGRERLRREALVARRLCKWLGYLPLGLELVGRYLLGDEELSLAEMLQNLEKERLQHQALDEVPQEMVVKLGIAAAFELSWRRLRENAQRLGCLLSLFALAPIPWELVESITINNEAQDWKKARHDLLQLHLLQHKGEGLYQLHPLLREFLQDKLTGLEQADDWKRGFAEAMVVVAKEIPQFPTLQTLTREDIESVKDIIPHLTEVAEKLTAAISDADLILVFMGLNKFYSGQRLYSFAKLYCKQGLSAIKERVGEEHLDVATISHSLALLYNIFQESKAEAEILCKQALEMRQRLLGKEHIEVATSLHDLGFLYYSQGRFTEAEILGKQALEMRQRLLGKEHIDVATSLDDLGGLYYSQGRFTEAEPLCKQAFEMRQRLLGEEYPFVAVRLSLQGEIYCLQGRYAEAEPLCKQVLEMGQRLLGEEQPCVAMSLNNLAEIYYLQGRFTEAEPLCKQALELNRRLLGENHLSVAMSLDSLGNIHHSQGRYAEAEDLYKQAFEMRQRLLGENHPLVAMSLDSLGNIHHSQGRYTEAEDLCKQALEMRQRLLGENHPLVAMSLNNLAEVYHSQGRYTEAEDLCKQALEMRQRLLGENHPLVAMSLNNLAKLYHLQGRYAEAKTLYKKALSIAELSLGVDHPRTATIRENLKSLHDDYV